MDEIRAKLEEILEFPKFHCPNLLSSIRYKVYIYYTKYHIWRICYKMYGFPITGFTYELDKVCINLNKT
jgi:hypothetical protein